MLDRLITLVSQLGHWGYLVVFLAVTLESAAFLGFVVPGETLVLVRRSAFHVSKSRALA